MLEPVITMTNPLLEIKVVEKCYNGAPTLKKVSVSVGRGEILCFLGPSGCGKTTLLRIIAGLENADAGQVIFEGVDLAGIPPHKRHFSMMFQEFALFPHKNLFENVAFGLRMQKLKESEVRRRALEMIHLVGLKGKEERDVAELSGGERQRVALARSLAPNPKLLMLDEPMGSLDRALRERLVNDLRRILKEVDTTALFVTHDQAEAFVLADRIAVFNTGYIEQIGTPEALYQKPVNGFVARFLGFQNLISSQEMTELLPNSSLGIKGFDGAESKTGQTQELLIRPEAARIVFSENDLQKDEVIFEGEMIDRRFQGSVCHLLVRIRNGKDLVFHFSSDSDLPETGQSVLLALRTSGMVSLGSGAG